MLSRIISEVYQLKAVHAILPDRSLGLHIKEVLRDLPLNTLLSSSTTNSTSPSSYFSSFAVHKNGLTASTGENIPSSLCRNNSSTRRDHLGSDERRNIRRKEEDEGGGGEGSPRFPPSVQENKISSGTMLRPYTLVQLLECLVYAELCIMKRNPAVSSTVNPMNSSSSSSSSSSFSSSGYSVLSPTLPFSIPNVTLTSLRLAQLLLPQFSVVYLVMVLNAYCFLFRDAIDWYRSNSASSGGGGGHPAHHRSCSSFPSRGNEESEGFLSFLLRFEKKLFSRIQEEMEITKSSSSSSSSPPSFLRHASAGAAAAFPLVLPREALLPMAEGLSGAIQAPPAALWRSWGYHCVAYATGGHPHHIVCGGGGGGGSVGEDGKAGRRRRGSSGEGEFPPFSTSSSSSGSLPSAGSAPFAYALAPWETAEDVVGLLHCLLSSSARFLPDEETSSSSSSSLSSMSSAGRFVHLKGEMKGGSLLSSPKNRNYNNVEEDEESDESGGRGDVVVPAVQILGDGIFYALEQFITCQPRNIFWSASQREELVALWDEYASTCCSGQLGGGGGGGEEHEIKKESILLSADHYHHRRSNGRGSRNLSQRSAVSRGVNDLTCSATSPSSLLFLTPADRCRSLRRVRCALQGSEEAERREVGGTMPGRDRVEGMIHMCELDGVESTKSEATPVHNHDSACYQSNKNTNRAMRMKREAVEGRKDGLDPQAGTATRGNSKMDDVAPMRREKMDPYPCITTTPSSKGNPFAPFLSEVREANLGNLLEIIQREGERAERMTRHSSSPPSSSSSSSCSFFDKKIGALYAVAPPRRNARREGGAECREEAGQLLLHPMMVTHMGLSRGREGSDNDDGRFFFLPPPPPHSGEHRGRTDTILALPLFHPIGMEAFIRRLTAILLGPSSSSPSSNPSTSFAAPTSTTFPPSSSLVLPHPLSPLHIRLALLILQGLLTFPAHYYMCDYDAYFPYSYEVEKEEREGGNKTKNMKRKNSTMTTQTNEAKGEAEHGGGGGGGEGDGERASSFAPSSSSSCDTDSSLPPPSSKCCGWRTLFSRFSVLHLSHLFNMIADDVLGRRGGGSHFFSPSPSPPIPTTTTAVSTGGPNAGEQTTATREAVSSGRSSSSAFASAGTGGGGPVYRVGERENQQLLIIARGVMHHLGRTVEELKKEQEEKRRCRMRRERESGVQGPAAGKPAVPLDRSRHDNSSRSRTSPIDFSSSSSSSAAAALLPSSSVEEEEVVVEEEAVMPHYFLHQLVQHFVHHSEMRFVHRAGVQLELYTSAMLSLAPYGGLEGIKQHIPTLCAVATGASSISRADQIIFVSRLAKVVQLSSSSSLTSEDFHKIRDGVKNVLAVMMSNAQHHLPSFTPFTTTASSSSSGSPTRSSMNANGGSTPPPPSHRSSSSTSLSTCKRWSKGLSPRDSRELLHTLLTLRMVDEGVVSGVIQCMREETYRFSSMDLVEHLHDLGRLGVKHLELYTAVALHVLGLESSSGNAGVHLAVRPHSGGGASSRGTSVWKGGAGAAASTTTTKELCLLLFTFTMVLKGLIKVVQSILSRLQLCGQYADLQDTSLALYSLVKLQVHRHVEVSRRLCDSACHILRLALAPPRGRDEKEEDADDGFGSGDGDGMSRKKTNGKKNDLFLLRQTPLSFSPYSPYSSFFPPSSSVSSAELSSIWSSLRVLNYLHEPLLLATKDLLEETIRTVTLPSSSTTLAVGGGGGNSSASSSLKHCAAIAAPPPPRPHPLPRWRSRELCTTIAAMVLLLTGGPPAYATPAEDPRHGTAAPSPPSTSPATEGVTKNASANTTTTTTTTKKPFKRTTILSNSFGSIQGVEVHFQYSPLVPLFRDLCFRRRRHPHPDHHPISPPSSSGSTTTTTTTPTTMTSGGGGATTTRASPTPTHSFPSSSSSLVSTLPMTMFMDSQQLYLAVTTLRRLIKPPSPPPQPVVSDPSLPLPCFPLPPLTVQEYASLAVPCDRLATTFSSGRRSNSAFSTVEAAVEVVLSLHALRQDIVWKKKEEKEEIRRRNRSIKMMEGNHGQENTADGSGSLEKEERDEEEESEEALKDVLMEEMRMWRRPTPLNTPFGVSAQGSACGAEHSTTFATTTTSSPSSASFPVFPSHHPSTSTTQPGTSSSHQRLPPPAPSPPNPWAPPLPPRLWRFVCDNWGKIEFSSSALREELRQSGVLSEFTAQRRGRSRIVPLYSQTRLCEDESMEDGGSRVEKEERGHTTGSSPGHPHHHSFSSSHFAEGAGGWEGGNRSLDHSRAGMDSSSSPLPSQLQQQPLSHEETDRRLRIPTAEEEEALNHLEHLTAAKSTAILDKLTTFSSSSSFSPSSSLSTSTLSPKQKSTKSDKKERTHKNEAGKKGRKKKKN